jgi:hypothetical protein
VAQKTRVNLVDDTDGSEITDGGERVRFGLDGVMCAVDLTDKNAARLRDVCHIDFDHERRVRGRRHAMRTVADVYQVDGPSTSASV